MSDLLCSKDHCHDCSKLSCLYNEKYNSTIKDVEVFPQSDGTFRVQVNKSIDFGEKGISVGDFLASFSR